MSALIVTAIQPALAHTPYLLPTNFAITKDHVTLEGAMGDVFFVPDNPLRTTSFVVADPNGGITQLTGTAFKDLVIVEAPIGKDGTYKISTEVPGRSMKMAKVDGKWQMVRPKGMQGGRGIDEASLAAGVATIETSNMMLLETYVTKGAPSPVKVSGKGFELKPATHPNEIFVDEGFSFALQFDGKPLKGLSVDVYRSGNAYDDKKVVSEVKTDDKGDVALSFDKPGVYLMTARYPERGEPGAEPAAKTYTYSLTFEVAP